MHLHHCRCFQEHVRMLLQSLRALCKAQGGAGNIWKYFEGLARATGVSGRLAYGFRTKLHFPDVPVAYATGRVAYVPLLLCARKVVMYTHHQNDTCVTLFAGGCSYGVAVYTTPGDVHAFLRGSATYYLSAIAKYRMPHFPHICLALSCCHLLL